METSIKMTIYQVTGKTIPGSSEQTVGYYSNEETAKKVVALVRDVNKKEIPVDVKFQKCIAEVTKMPEGFCLKNEECMELIKNELNRDEYKRIVNMEFAYDFKYLKGG